MSDDADPQPGDAAAGADRPAVDLTVEANGLEFACLCEGSGDRLALCLHGFPDDAGSMRPLLDRLAAEGFTAVAPYMRGYAPTDPAPDDDYGAAALGRDAIELAGALGDELGTGEAVLVGHDWGAEAAYAAMRAESGAFERYVAMAVPPRFAALLSNHPRQVLRSWYMWFFQLPDAPERALRWRDYALVEFLWGTWSPSWDYLDERVESVKATLDRGDTVEHALAYYRQIVGGALRGMVRSGGLPSADDRPALDADVLVLAGEEDGCIGPELFADAGDAFAGETRVLEVRDAGHFLHQERPAVVGDEVAAFLAPDA